MRAPLGGTLHGRIEIAGYSGTMLTNISNTVFDHGEETSWYLARGVV